MYMVISSSTNKFGHQFVTLRTEKKNGFSGIGDSVLAGYLNTHRNTLDISLNSSLNLEWFPEILVLERD